MKVSAAIRRAGVVASAVALLLTAAPAAFPRPQPSASPVGAHCGAHRELRHALRTLVTRDRIAGAAVVVTDSVGEAGPSCGRWTQTAGTADLRSGRPMNATDRLRIGSVTKTFTAAVVLQLAAEHRVLLDAPVDRYLPGLIRSHGFDGRRITVRHLLRHTSKLPDYLDAPEWEHPERMRRRHFEPRELVARALELPHPQSAWHYATTNYLIAGLIIQQVTGNTPETEITRRILRPLGLRDSYWPGDDVRIRGTHSRSYFTDEDGHRVDGTDWNMTFGGVGGALVSTPDDVAHFVSALMSGRLLPPAQLAAMRQTVTADPDRLWPGARYGLGLISTPLRCGGLWWGHAGTVPGGHRALTAVGPGGRSISVALNGVPDSLPAEQVFHDVVQAAFCDGRPFERTHT
ncbi:serine hydrolase domain-containing protein [Streptomyces sp. NPDC004752]